MKLNKEYRNAVVIRHVRGEEMLKGIRDDVIREPKGVEHLEILVLAKDNFDISHFSEKLKKRGIVVRFEVVPCG